MKQLLKEFIYGKPIKGEPATIKKHIRKTVTPNNTPLLKWYSGGWNKFIHNHNNKN